LTEKLKAEWPGILAWMIDGCADWLERGLATGAIGSFYKDEPVWDPIRSDPRFTDLIRRMGIPS